MIYTKKFEFGSKNLILKTITSLDARVEKDIQLLVNTFLKELNHNVRNSSAKNFNESQEGSEVFVEKIFMDFLEYNIDFFKHFSLGEGGVNAALPKSFTPFKFESTLKTHLDLKDLFKVEKSNSTISKLKNFTLDTSFLRSSYVVELLKNFLKEKKIADFLIILPDSISAVGKYKWQCNFIESESFKTRTFDLLNLNAFFIDNFKENFGLKELVLIGKDLSYLKLIGISLRSFDKPFDLNQISAKYQIDIIATDFEDKLKIYRGLV